MATSTHELPVQYRDPYVRRHEGRSAVLWVGTQWSVTSDGIESRSPHEGIVLRKELLSKPDEGFRCFAVVADAVRLAWLDVDDFRQAWREAQRLHACAFENVPLVWREALEKGTSALLDMPLRRPSAPTRM